MMEHQNNFFLIPTLSDKLLGKTLRHVPELFFRLMGKLNTDHLDRVIWFRFFFDHRNNLLWIYDQKSSASAPLLTKSPWRYVFIVSFSAEGVNPVVAGFHTPTPLSPPSSALVILTRVSLGTVLTAWLSASPPKIKDMNTFAL